MIYCVEDDKDIRDIEIYTLTSMGLETRGFESASVFMEALKENMPSLVLLDVMLPDADGVELLKKLRENVRTRHLPVIMATARGAEYERICALDSGADDYLTKPFSMMEMVARVKAVLRRCEDQHDSVIRVGQLEVNESTYSARIDGSNLNLSRKEFELLLLLLSHPNRVFSREQLLDRIWGIEYDGENRTVDVHIRTLRQKLGSYEKIIHTLRGVGYKAEV